MKHEVRYGKFSGFDAAADLLKTHADRLREYVDQLLWWNERVNLVSRDVSRETIVEHVRHSLMLTESELYRSSGRIIDAGTGGGLPGVPLAIVDENKEIVLNDIVSKKVMACKQMILKLKLKNCKVYDGSISDIELNQESCIVSKHAFKINDLIGTIGKKPWLGALLLKGGDEVESELDGIDRPLKINVLSLEQRSNPFYAGKALVEITKL